MIKKLSSLLFSVVIICSTSIYSAQEKFGDEILLIINYNTPHYGSIDFLKELYSLYFPHIIFVGPQVHPQVEYCEHRKGWFAYKAFALAMKKYPDFKGYLYVHDDCIFNPWNFNRFDKNKIWFIKSNVNRLGTPEVQNWWFKNAEVGLNAIAKAFDQFPQKNKDILAQSCKNSNAVMSGYSDIGYIPARFKEDVIALSEILATNKAFLEIGLPTMLGALDAMENWQYIEGLAFWNRQNPQTLYRKELDYLHPMKLSNMGHRVFIKKQFATMAGNLPA